MLRKASPTRNFMRMFAEVGRRTHPHATAVGKAMLADASAEEVRSLLARTGMPRYTDRTLLTPDVFLAELDTARTLGYATDEGEQELGVRCIAVAVPDAPPADGHLHVRADDPGHRRRGRPSIIGAAGRGGRAQRRTRRHRPP
jgi:DNA-binding IclR family transcriptional regulator